MTSPILEVPKPIQQMFVTLLSSYSPILEVNQEEFANGKKNFRPPLFPKHEMLCVLEQTESLFATEPVMLELKSPFIVVGDIHGHILDLFRIFQKFGFPPGVHYLFLGDYIDRGEFSLETITFILILKAAFPDCVYLIRGNHEFESVCVEFTNSVNQLYPNTNIFASFMKTFSQIPLSAIVDDDIFCVHGGISSELLISPETGPRTLFSSFARPIYDFNNALLNDILWSDPSEDCTDFMPSFRGGGHIFGRKAFDEVMAKLKCSTLIRGHQCISTGYNIHFEGRLITIFSASNYCGTAQNRSAVLILKKGEQYFQSFNPLPYIRRQTEATVPVTIPKSLTACALSIPKSFKNVNNKRPASRINPAQSQTLAFHPIAHTYQKSGRRISSMSHLP